VLEVYGTGYQDEVWSFRVEELTHRDRVIKELKVIVHLFELAIIALDKSNEKGNPKFNHFLKFSKTMLEALIAIQHERKAEDGGDVFAD
jgi:hypothetical protein